MQIACQLRGGVIPVASVRLSAAPLCKGAQWVCRGAEEIGFSFQQWSVTGLKTRKEDRSRSIANGFSIFRLGESAIHLRCLVGDL